jgi:hypothetical protein
MVIGTAGDLPKPPSEKIVFLEDMTDSQLADAVRSPSSCIIHGAGLTSFNPAGYAHRIDEVCRLCCLTVPTSARIHANYPAWAIHAT